MNGRPVMCHVLGNGERVIMFIATIHGNENAGTTLVRSLMSYLKKWPQIMSDRTVIVVPVSNPDGLAHNTRFNARGIDLNRNFAAGNRENNARYGMAPLSEPESRILLGLIERFRPERIITLHQPLEMIDWDGPGQALAEYMARFTDLPAKRLGSRPGSLGSYAGGKLGIPIVTWELPREADALPAEALWQKYGPAALAAIIFPSEMPAGNDNSPSRRMALLAPVGLLFLAVAGAAVWVARDKRKV